MGYRVFFTIVLVFAVVTFGAYSLAAHLDSDSADAQTTWQYDRLVDDDELQYVLETLSSACIVDWEPLNPTDVRGYDYIGIAYSCPD